MQPKATSIPYTDARLHIWMYKRNARVPCISLRALPIMEKCVFRPLDKLANLFLALPL